jgi:hypothetical protein
MISHESNFRTAKVAANAVSSKICGYKFLKILDASRRTLLLYRGEPSD